MSTRNRGSLGRSIALAACALALPAVAALGERDAQKDGQKDSKPSQKDISRELKELHESDQKDQNDPSWNEATDAEFGGRQKLRRDRVMEIIEAGMLADLRDWDRAAILLQHGQSGEDFLLAHILSVPPGIADTGFGKFMCAATLDRFLWSCGRAQIFTTQSGAADPNVYAPSEPFDDSMNQSLRALFSLPALRGRAETKKAKKGKGPSAKDLPTLLELSSKEPAAGQDAPEWLLQTREIVLGDTLKAHKDLDQAARILGASRDPDDLLSAHVLALAAAFKARSPAARVACAESLDRFLLAIGRKQCFDTVRENGKPLDPRAPLPDFILREYGLSP